jgi:hypothetical protein
MDVELLFYRKNIESNGDIVEMKIWQVPQTKDKPYGYRYSLVYIRDNKRIVGYDNGEGKGDHRHYRNNEHPYDFKGMDTLIEDFYKDVEKIRKGEL